jgi:hypothetical protein
MKFTTKRINPDWQQPWFAWHPVQVDQRSNGPQYVTKWVWLERVTRHRIKLGGHFLWRYTL